jgi:hypothetical protein
MKVSPYVVSILENLEEGDTIRVSFNHRGESMRYSGAVKKIEGLKVRIENDEEMNLFEALAYPQVMDVNLESVWFYSITKQNGQEIYR